MAKRIFQNSNFTPAVVADAATMTNGNYMACKGGSATQFIDFLEFMISGMAGASTPTPLCFARSAAIATGPTQPLVVPATDGAESPFTAALAAAPVTFNAATTGPQRSAAVTDARLLLGLNAFGGIVRWNAAPGQQYSGYGATAPNGENYLSSLNYGTPGLLQAHIIYEPM